MSIYFAPALISLLFKLFVLAYVVKGARVSVVFLSLIVVFAAHNSIEFIIYLYIQTTVPADILLRLYYVATIYVVLYMFLHALSVSKTGTQLVTSALIAVSTILSILLLFTDVLIAGLYSIGYTITAVKGPLYWLFATYMLTFLSSSFMVTFYGYKRAETKIDSVRCLHSILALAPLALVGILILSFNIANIEINATGLIPIATTLFLIIVLKTESKHKLSDLRRVLPLSAERKTTDKLMGLLDSYIQNSNQSNVYKELQDGIEKEIIEYSLKKCGGNVTSTAKMMGLKNRSTLYSMMNRLEMDLKALKLQTID